MKKQIGVILLGCIALFVCTSNLCIAQSNSAPSGFAPAETMSDADAFNYVNQYKAVYGKNANAVSGGVITREALDQILRTENCNAVTYRLGMDPTGRIAPADAVFIILSGANVTDNNGTKTVTDIGTPKYSPSHWCPPSCMKFMILDPATGVTSPKE